MVRLGLLTGTGMAAAFDSAALGEEWQETQTVSSTPFGEVPLTVLESLEGRGNCIVLLKRHHGENGRSTPPHAIEHRANIFALDAAGCDAVLATYSVGTMVEWLPPGDVGLIGDLLDLTGRVCTFHDDDAIHTDLSDLYSSDLRTCLREKMDDFNHPGECILAMMTGPHYETPAQIRALTTLGADLVGMTASGEALLLAELERPLVALALSSNHAAGMDPKGVDVGIDHHQVDDQAERMAVVVRNAAFVLLNHLQSQAS